MDDKQVLTLNYFGNVCDSRMGQMQTKVLLSNTNNSNTNSPSPNSKAKVIRIPTEEAAHSGQQSLKMPELSISSRARN